MKKYFNVLIIMSMVMTITSCGAKKPDETTKSLVLYYSQTGATKTVANELKALLGADIDSIVVAENPYTGDFQQTIVRCQQEMKDSILPSLKPLTADLAKYDTIYLGYPVWFGTFARPMISYLKSAKLAGKVVIPFCTFGSGGLVETTAELKKMMPEATILDGYGVRNARVEAVPQELNRFLKERHYIAGEVEALPDYSEQKEISDEEKQIFEQACSDYPFPLGKPVTVGSRKSGEGTDYQYKSELSYSADDTPSVFTIYVTAVEGKKPYFTRVDR